MGHPGGGGQVGFFDGGYNERNAEGIAVLSALFELVVSLLAVWFVWRFIAQRLPKSSKPSEPGDYAGSPARLRPRPRQGAGAIALAEPDEDDEEEIDPPRRA